MLDRIFPAEARTAEDPLALDHVETWIFDLDNTLYPAACNLFAQIDLRMTAYICDLLDLEPEEARRLQKAYYHEHGTTLNGLIRMHAADPTPYLDYVHDIDLSAVEPAPELENRLAALPGRKVVFTNGSLAHAERVLERLGVTHHFEDIFDIVAANYVPKPNADTYAAFVERCGIEPRTAIMFDDLSRNLLAAHDLGMTTVWVRTGSEWSRAPEPDDEAHIDYVCDDLLGFLRRIAPREAEPETNGVSP